MSFAQGEMVIVATQGDAEGDMRGNAEVVSQALEVCNLRAKSSHMVMEVNSMTFDLGEGLQGERDAFAAFDVTAGEEFKDLWRLGLGGGAGGVLSW